MTRLALGAGGMALIVLLLGWFHLHQVEAARQQGIRDERLVWQQRQAAVTAKAEADRQAAQDKINAAEKSYLEQRAAAEIQKSDLKKALDNEKASARACAAVTRELRDNLARIGARP